MLSVWQAQQITGDVGEVWKGFPLTRVGEEEGLPPARARQQARASQRPQIPKTAFESGQEDILQLQVQANT